MAAPFASQSKASKFQDAAMSERLDKDKPGRYPGQPGVQINKKPYGGTPGTARGGAVEPSPHHERQGNGKHALTPESSSTPAQKRLRIGGAAGNGSSTTEHREEACGGAFGRSDQEDSDISRIRRQPEAASGTIANPEKVQPD